jgi:hypothetical protein
MHRCEACEEVEAFSGYFGRGVYSSSRGEQLHPQLVVVLRAGGEEEWEREEAVRERKEGGRKVDGEREREMRESEREMAEERR